MADSRSVVVEIYLALERATGEGNIQKARRAARAAGFSFRNAESVEWLRPFTEAARVRRGAPIGEPVGAPVLSTNGHHSGHLDGLARGNCTPSLIPVDSLRSSTRNGEPKRERAIKLPFDRETLDRRNAILKAVWGCVQPHIGRATTFTAWRDRNAKSARSLAEAGVDAARAVAAWEVACRKYGEPVRQLSAVQDTLAWYEANKERQHA